MQQNRRLTAILFTDIVGSTSMMQKDEQTAMAVNKRYVSVLKQFVLSHGGEILNDFGDGSLCCFSSVTEALRCAIEMQQQFQLEPQVPLRIGLHVGEIIFEDGKVFGDGVNVASRVQSLGIVNSILFSSEINSKIKNQTEFKCVSIGKFHFKNVDEPMEVFALTNEGLTVPKKEELTGKLKEIKKSSFRKKIIITISALILLTAVSLIYRNFNSVKGFSGGDKTIAVLPFENVGIAGNEEYISDGITQDIINSLSKISSLKKVIGWFSVKSFKKTTKTIKQIADDLDVSSILTGTIQQQGDSIRIITELIDVKTNKRLWGEDYNYGSKNILSIQRNVAVQIVTALKANLTLEEQNNLSKHSTENEEAYDFYNKGRSFFTGDSAEANYRRAIQLDAGYAPPYAGLAECYIFKRTKDFSQFDVMLIAKQYAEKALLLDSTLCEAYTALGFIQQSFLYKWDESKKTLEKAIKLNPNYSQAHLYYGNLLVFTGNTEAGLNEVKKALDLDPLNLRINWALGRNYYFAGKYDLAIKQLQKTIFIGQEGRGKTSMQDLGCVYLAKKLYPQARDEFDQLAPDDKNWLDNNQIIQSYAYAVMGDKAKAKTLFEKTLKEHPFQSPYKLGYVYTALGNFSEALNQLDLGYETRDLQMFFIKVDPRFEPLRNEPRFETLLKKMHLD